MVETDGIDELLKDKNEATFPVPNPEFFITIVIVGIGKVGSALWGAFAKSLSRVIPVDPERGFPAVDAVADHLHICFPYSNNYTEKVISWVSQYKPSVLFLHSLIPVGTTQVILTLLEEKGFKQVSVMHMPPVGEHPFLQDQFTKYLHIVGPSSMDAAKLASEKLLQLGNIKMVFFSSPFETELASLLYYVRIGLDRLFLRCMGDICKSCNIDSAQAIYGWTEVQNRSRIISKVGDTQLLPNINFDANPGMAMVIDEALACLLPFESAYQDGESRNIAFTLFHMASFHNSITGERDVCNNRQEENRGRNKTRGRSRNKRQRKSCECAGSDAASCDGQVGLCKVPEARRRP